MEQETHFYKHDPWETVLTARNGERPTAKDYIESIFEDFTELHGDRLYRDDPSIIGGIARLGNMPVTVIGQQKGRSLEENIERNFAMPYPEGYRKSLRLAQQAEKFGRPIVFFVDTPGAHCGLEAEERGQGHAIASNLFHLSDLTVPIISIVIGEGGSGGALALTVADRIWMLEYAIYSVLSPEGFAAILWKDSKRAEEAAKIMNLTAYDLLEDGIADRLIPEPQGGVSRTGEYRTTMRYLKDLLLQEITELKKHSTKTLLKERYSKFRNMGL
jgi:acetyl-CoA carboxylase carboxyl transferase alpha subunit